MQEVIEQATLTVDLVMLAMDSAFQRVGHVLLIDGKSGWCLPGGKVRKDEEILDALNREMQEEIGLFVLAYPCGVYPRVGRDTRGRYVSFAYSTVLTSVNQVEPVAGSDAKEVRWFDLSALPELVYDHKFIIECAVRGLPKGMRG